MGVVEDVETSLTLSGSDGVTLDANLVFALVTVPANGVLATSPGGVAVTLPFSTTGSPTAPLYYTPAADTNATTRHGQRSW